MEKAAVEQATGTGTRLCALVVKSAVQLKFGKFLLIYLKATGPHLVPRLAGSPGGGSARGLAR